MFKKLISLTLTLSFLLQQTVFAYTASLNLSGYLNQGPNLAVSDRFRPINLRYFSYQPLTNDFKILLDKGDSKDIADTNLKSSATILLDYFKIGLSLPNDKFWVNLRPDSQDQIIDDELAKTDLGKVMLEADLKLKQDTALFTSPKTPQGKAYWDKLYQRAGELFGTENITIPTLTRPWIVPGEIILRESSDNNSKTSQGAYIYKANLKVMLEEDYLKSSQPSAIGSRPSEPNNQPLTSNYNFSDPRLKELNQYSTQLIRELILPKLTQKVNSSKDYANLRQVYFSLILARWFKESFRSQSTEHRAQSTDKTNNYVNLIDSKDLSSLTSKQAWDKTTYFNAYQKSFKEGEYNLSEPVYTPTGQVIRRYMSGGLGLNNLIIHNNPVDSKVGLYTTPEENIVSSAIEDKVVFTGDEIGTQEVNVESILLEYEIYKKEGKLNPEEEERVKTAREHFDRKELIKAADILLDISFDNRKDDDKGGWSLYGRARHIYTLLQKSNEEQSAGRPAFETKGYTKSGSPLELKAKLLSIMNKYHLAEFTKELENKQNVADLKELIEKMFQELELSPVIGAKEELVQFLKSLNVNKIIAEALKNKIDAFIRNDNKLSFIQASLGFKTNIQAADIVLNYTTILRFPKNIDIELYKDKNDPWPMVTIYISKNNDGSFKDIAVSLPQIEALDKMNKLTFSQLDILADAIMGAAADEYERLISQEAVKLSLEQSKETINSLMRAIEKENAKGNESQALTALLTALPNQLKTIDQIAVDAKPENAVKAIEEIVKILKILKEEEPNLGVYLSLRSEILKTTIPALESIIKTIQEKRAGSPIISAVERLQNQLPDDVNEQVLKFVANVNDNEELKYPIKKDDPIMIGHVRGDRAGYLALGLQARDFKNLLGYIKFNKDFKGVSVLPEEAVGKISNTFFERISNLGYTSVKISEDEKKEHTGYNANGRNEQPFPGERRVVIKMQKSSKAYVDTPEMRMKEVADAVLTELDGNVDFILTNFLSSDMMKHTGNFEAAKKSNEITDQQLGRIKGKIDVIKGEIIEKIRGELYKYFPETEDIIYLSYLLNADYDKFLSVVLEKNKEAYNAIKSLEQQVPLFVITADHGASEEGLKENPKESNNFHTANPVPYIIYDPLRKQEIPLKEGKTIRNNAATLLQLLGEEIPREYDESLLPADYQGSKRRIAFAVLDGWGINPDQSYPYDAIRLADTPNYDWFVENVSFTKLQAHGEVIGLRKILSYEEGPHHLRGLQAGQTDIGHIHLFSGREVKQPLWYIDQLIKGGLSNGVFDETKEEVKVLIRELNKVKEKGLKFHYITVGSEGGVHASLYHMYALMRLAKKVGLAKDQFVIHFGADGRDVPTRSAHLYLEDVYKRIEEIGIGVIPVVFGRDMLVRKEGAENITNRLIDVLSGENLKGDDVTLVEETSKPKDTSDAIIRKSQEVYNRIAPEYSAIWGDDVQEEVKRHREAFLEIIPKNAAVVDAGTGPGRDAARFNDNGLQAIGIDFSGKMIAEARKRHPSLQFKQMDLRYLEIDSNTIDGIWDNAAFHHLPLDAARQALKEYYRVMKTDGMLFLRVKQGDGEVLQPDKKYPDETRYFKLYQKDELENLAAFQGFEIIKSGTEIDSKKPEQTWVYLFARKAYSTSSPLTVEILKKIEWNNIVWNSFKEILEEQFEKIQESHGKLFVIDNFWKQFNEEKSDNKKIQAILNAIAVSTPETAKSSEIKEANKKELRELIFGGLKSYYQKISREIKAYLLTVDVSKNADLENKRKSILAEIKDIEDYSHKKEGHNDYFRDKKIVFQLNMAAHIWKMMQEKAPLSNILEQSFRGASSALTGNDALSEYIHIINDYETRFKVLLNQYFDQSRGPNVDTISREVMEGVQAGFIAEVSWLKKVPETDMLLDVCLKNILERKTALSKPGMWISKHENFVDSRQPENTNVLKMLGEWRPLLKDMDNKIEGLVKKIENDLQTSSSILDGQKVLGGIDFRSMNMLIQPQGSFASSSLDFSLPALSKAQIESFDLDTELAAIQKMASSGIAPSDERLKEYLAVCFAKEKTGKEIDSLKLCLLDVFEQQQLEARETPNGYKEVLVIADTRGYVLKEGRLAASPQNLYSLN